MSLPELSVVIVARNEELTIGPCVESIIRATASYRTEILFVDSASSDGTVDVARRYPVAIAGFRDTGLLSPAAGRWLGTDLTHGEWLFFVDGDMIVVDGWITCAMKVLQDRSIGGVSGRLFPVAPGEPLDFSREDGLPLGVVPGLGGAALYRRQALDECGTFNPFLRGEEERELAYRLSRRGYSVVRVEHPMAHHLDKERSVQENTGRAVYFAGVGQIMRQYALQPPFWELLREHSEVFLAWIAGFLLLAGMIVLGLIERGGWFFGMGGAVVLGLAFLLLRKGPKRIWLFLHSRALLSVHFILGILRGLPPPGRYPRDFVWIRKESLTGTNPAGKTS
jgi:glycosyltransferase involved in cell wall biosynthesis